MKTPRASAVLLAVTCLWGSTFIVSKDLLVAAPPFRFMMYRFVAAAFLLLPLLLWRWRHARTRGFVRDSLVLGLLNASGLPLQVFGQLYTSPSKSAFITSMNTPLTALAGLLIYRTLPTHKQRIAIAIASFGLLLLTWPPPGSTFNTGDLLTLGCAAFYALFIVEAARRAPRHDAIALTVAQVTIAAGLYVGLWSICHVSMKLMSEADWPLILRLEVRAFPTGTYALIEMAYMSIVCVAVAMLAQTWALQRLSASSAAVIFALEPVFATMFAVAIGGVSEWPGPRGATGGFLVLCAVYVTEARLRRRTKPYKASKKNGAAVDESEDDMEQPFDSGAQ